MLCRSTSTGVLSTLLPAVSSHLQPGVFDQHERNSSDLYQYHYSPAQHVSTPRSSLQSPASQYLRPSAGDGGDWEFEGPSLVQSRPTFRKVQSENDLQSLWRTSSGSAATFAAAESFNSSTSSQGYEDDRVQLRTLDRLGSERESAILEMSENSEDVSSAGSEVSEEDRRDISLTMDNGSYWNDRTLTMGKQPSALQQQDMVPGPICMLPTYAESSSLRGSRGSSKVDNSASFHTSEHETMSVVRSMGASTLERSVYTSASSQTEIRGPMLITDIGFGNGSGGGGRRVSGGRGGGSGGGGYGDSPQGMEAQYQRMLEADPGHPLLLSNYAQFLHEVKRDPLKAEPYYERAILANPGDGEVLGRYAKLIWEVYKDEDRAGGYFEQALQACPDDCHLNAAYASFLWSSEVDDEDVEVDPPLEVAHNNGGRYINNMSPVYGAAAHS
ncbi:unnamed protein product [Calypogeia fissa]